MKGEKNKAKADFAKGPGTAARPSRFWRSGRSGRSRTTPVILKHIARNAKLMAIRPPRLVPAVGILGWIPQIVKLSQSRFRSQIRLLGLAALVGVVAGLGAIVFYVGHPRC